MSEIKPALTAEEWTGPNCARDGIVFSVEHDRIPWLMIGDGADGFALADLESRHALAALALHRQPFGFTWEDVDMLRGVAKTAYLMMENRPDGYWSGDVARADKLAADLAARIAALLPPREP